MSSFSVLTFSFAACLDRWKTRTSDEGTAEKKTRAGSFSCEHQPFFFTTLSVLATSFHVRNLCVLFPPETYRDAEQ